MEGWGKTLSCLLLLSGTRGWRRTIPSAASTAPLELSPGLLLVLLPSGSRGTAESPRHCVYSVRGRPGIRRGLQMVWRLQRGSSRRDESVGNGRHGKVLLGPQMGFPRCTYMGYWEILQCWISLNFCLSCSVSTRKRGKWGHTKLMASNAWFSVITHIC